MAQDSMLDVMNGLEGSTDALALPHTIIELENEHQNAVVYNHQPPIPAPGLDEVEEREQVPDMLDPEADLARDLENFQEFERILFGNITSRGVSSGPETLLHELAELEYYNAEDESMEELLPA